MCVCVCVGRKRGSTGVHIFWTKVSLRKDGRAKNFTRNWQTKVAARRRGRGFETKLLFFVVASKTTTGQHVLVSLEALNRISDLAHIFAAYRSFSLRKIMINLRHRLRLRDKALQLKVRYRSFVCRG